MKQDPAVLVTDYVHPNLINGLREDGYKVTYAPEISLSLVHEIIDAYAGIVINTRTPVREEMMSKASRLQFIARLGSGLEIIDLKAAKRHRISVYRAAAANANAVAEHVVGMLLGLFRNLRTAGDGLREMRFDREENRGGEIEGKTIGIIGFGNTGSRLAGKLQGWGARVLAYDKYLDSYTEGIPYVEESSMEYLLSHSDVVSLHIPLTEETEHLVDRSFFQMMKKGAILVNTSRGKIVNTQALIEALDRGTLGGACLDVFENEKPLTYSQEERKVYSDLFSRKNVVVSPHIAGWTIESKRKISDTLLDKIRTG